MENITQEKTSGFYEKLVGLPKVIKTICIISWTILRMWTVYGYSPVMTLAYLSALQDSSIIAESETEADFCSDESCMSEFDEVEDTILGERCFS